jgi:hypothetical protein
MMLGDVGRTCTLAITHITHICRVQYSDHPTVRGTLRVWRQNRDMYTRQLIGYAADLVVCEINLSVRTLGSQPVHGTNVEVAGAAWGSLATLVLHTADWTRHSKFPALAVVMTKWTN